MTGKIVQPISTTGIRPREFSDYLQGIVKSAGSPLSALGSIICIALTGDPESPRVLVAWVDNFMSRLMSGGMTVSFQLPPDARAIASVATNNGAIAVEVPHGLIAYPGFGSVIEALKVQLLDAVSKAGATMLLATPPDVNNRAYIAADGLPWKQVSVEGAPTRSFRFVPGMPIAIAVTGSQRMAVANTLNMERMVGDGNGWRKGDNADKCGYASLRHLSRVAGDGTVFVGTFTGRNVQLKMQGMETESFEVIGDSAITRVEGTVLGSVDIELEGKRVPNAAYAFLLPDDGRPNTFRVAYIPAKEIGREVEASAG